MDKKQEQEEVTPIPEEDKHKKLKTFDRAIEVPERILHGINKRFGYDKFHTPIYIEDLAETIIEQFEENKIIVEKEKGLNKEIIKLKAESRDTIKYTKFQKMLELAEELGYGINITLAKGRVKEDMIPF